MERLSDETLDSAINVYEYTVQILDKSKDENYCTALDKVTIKFLQELKEYRMLEEKGLIVKMPYPIHTKKLYFCDKENGEIVELNLDTFETNKLKYSDELIYIIDGYEFSFSDFGKIVFLSKYEAEQALKRLES